MTVIIDYVVCDLRVLGAERIADFRRESLAACGEK